VKTKNNLKHKLDTFNNSCDDACLKCKLPFDKTNGYLRIIHFLRKQCNINQTRNLSIPQGTVATFFRCGEQVHNHSPKISTGFCVPKIIQIYWFLTESLKIKGGGFLRQSVYARF